MFWGQSYVPINSICTIVKRITEENIRRLPFFGKPLGCDKATIGALKEIVDGT
jgi:hypothetical protein